MSMRSLLPLEARLPRLFCVLCLAAVWLTCPAAGAAPSPPSHPYESPTPFTPETPIDKAIAEGWARAGVTPPPLCSDAVFVRRAFLDAIGTLPTAAEARSFLTDPGPGKRRALIDRLLQRDEFADYWAMKWGDLLRVKAEFPINLWPNAAQAYDRWLRTALRENLPYDRFARALLTSSGSNFRVPPVNFYRAMQSKEPAAVAQTVALTFMGTRAEQWPGDMLARMVPCFAFIGTKPTAEWKEEIVFFDPARTNAPGLAPLPTTATMPDGTTLELTADRDPRAAFADWLLEPKNPWFARALVNRVWFWLLGRGLVHEPDDLRPDNPPHHPAVLALLERELIASRYDLKHVFRLILHSKTYQLSPIPRGDPTPAATWAACYPLRRIEAEVLIDALNQITGTTEKYSSAIPEPFTFIPEDQRSIALPDGSITSSFLELFGRPARDTGLELERNNRSTAAQRLHLLNSSHIQRKLEQGPRLRALTQSRGTPREIASSLYLTILSRFPTEAELQVLGRSNPGGGAGRERYIDLAWALVNGAEFLYRH